MVHSSIYGSQETLQGSIKDNSRPNSQASQTNAICVEKANDLPPNQVQDSQKCSRQGSFKHYSEPNSQANQISSVNVTEINDSAPKKALGIGKLTNFFFDVAADYGKAELTQNVQDIRILHFLIISGIALQIIATIFLAFVFKNYSGENITLLSNYELESAKGFRLSSLLMMSDHGFIREFPLIGSQQIDFPKLQKTSVECGDSGTFNCNDHHDQFATYYNQHIYYFTTNQNKNVVKQIIDKNNIHHREIPSSRILTLHNNGIVYSLHVGEFFWILGGVYDDKLLGPTGHRETSMWSFKREKWFRGPIMEEPIMFETFGYRCAVAINSTTIVHVGYKDVNIAYLHLFSTRWIVSSKKSAKSPLEITEAICTVGFDKDWTE